MKQKGKFWKKVGIASLLVLQLFSLSAHSVLAKDDDYSQMRPPTAFTTAFQEALKNIRKKQADEAKGVEGGTDKAIDGSKKAGDEKGGTGASSEEQQAVLNSNLALLAAQSPRGSISTGGVLIGPIENTGTIKYGNLIAPPAFTKEALDNLDSIAQKQVFDNYRTFGWMISKIKNVELSKSAQEQQSSSASDLDNAGNALADTIAKFGQMSFKIVKRYNPLPLIAGMYDSRFLTDNTFLGNPTVEAGEAPKENNQLVMLIQQQPILWSFFTTLGDRSTYGISPMMMISVGLIVLMFVMSFAMRMMGNRKLGERFRKSIVALVVIFVAVPGFCGLGVYFLNMVDKYTFTQPEYTAQVAARDNLLFSDWASVGFAISSNVTLKIGKSGKVTMSPEDVYQINKNTQRLLGNDSSDKAIADRLVEMASSGKNRSTVPFKEAIRQSDGKPWTTGKLYTAAAKFSKNERLTEEDVKDIGYLDTGTITASQAGATSFTGNGEKWGISPLAAFNILQTNFNDTGVSVSNVTEIPEIPNVVRDISQSDLGSLENNKQMPGIIRALIAISIIFAIVKALVSILIAVFGGGISGAFKSMFGSSRGAGELAGTVFALTFGTFMLSIIGVLALGLMGIVWDFVAELGFTKDANETMKPLLKALQDAISKIPLLNIFAGLTRGVGTFIMSILTGLLMLKLGKEPVTRYAQWVSSWPNKLGEWFQYLTNEFTGDFRAGSVYSGTPGSNTSQTIDNSINQSRGSLRAVGEGLALAGGAALATAGRGLEKQLGGKDGAGKDGTDKDGKDGKDPNGKDPNDMNQKATGDVLKDKPTDSKSDVNANHLTNKQEANQMAETISNLQEGDQEISNAVETASTDEALVAQEALAAEGVPEAVLGADSDHEHSKEEQEHLQQQLDTDHIEDKQLQAETQSDGRQTPAADGSEQSITIPTNDAVPVTEAPVQADSEIPQATEALSADGSVQFTQDGSGQPITEMNTGQDIEQLSATEQHAGQQIQADQIHTESHRPKAVEESRPKEMGQKEHPSQIKADSGQEKMAKDKLRSVLHNKFTQGLKDGVRNQTFGRVERGVEKAKDVGNQLKSSEGRKDLGHKTGMAFAKGLQAAGGNAKGRDFFKGVAHATAGAVGAQHLTQGMVNKAKGRTETVDVGESSNNTWGGNANPQASAQTQRQAIQKREMIEDMMRQIEDE